MMALLPDEGAQGYPVTIHSRACTLRTLADMLPSQSANRLEAPWSHADYARIDPDFLTLKRIVKRLHRPT
jgi:hypothetical protein